MLANTLVRNPWQLVGFVFGMLWAAGLLLLLVAGLVAVAVWQGAAEARVVAVLGGSLLVIGWIIGPVLIAGTDTTVDAARLAPFPLTTRQLMLALVGTGLTGIPGIATALAALATTVLWVRWPVAAVTGLVCAVIGVLICVLASRLMTTLASGLGAGRRGRELVGTVVLALIILSGPILTGALALLDAGDTPLARLEQAATVLGWTPLGAAWAVPADIAAGAVFAASVKFVIAVVSVGLLWVTWGAAGRAALNSPPRRTARAVKSGALGWFGRMPTGAVGATWARSLTAWLRDPRYLRQLILVPLLPVVFAITGGVDSALLAGSAVVVAFLIAIVGYSDISYDGTAFATVLATGVRGRHDRLGRLLGAACVGVPAIVVVAVVTLAITGMWHLLPAVLGAALALVLSGYAVSAVSSALIVSPVAAPGDSPFKTVPGQTFVNGLLVFVVMAAVLVLAAPALVLALIGILAASAALSWIALVVALALGTGSIIAGVVVGGRMLDKTGPDLLQRIKTFPTS